MIGLDTNVLVRYVTQDDPDQSPRANAVIAGLSRQHSRCYTTPRDAIEPRALADLYQRLSGGPDLARSLDAPTFDHQPHDHVRVMADPAGHVPCFVVDEG